MSLKAETEMAMKLLEKDIHEKQDTIVSLRRQLDDIKQINLEMYRKLQVRYNRYSVWVLHFLCPPLLFNVLDCNYSFMYCSTNRPEIVTKIVLR